MTRTRLLAGTLAATMLGGICGDGDYSGSSFPEAVASTAGPTITFPTTTLPTTRTDSSTAPSAPVAETGEVTVAGAPLPAFLGASSTDPSIDGAAGVTAPVVTGADYAGEPVTIGGARPQAIVFLAHWCPHCQAEVPRVQEWIDTEGGVPGVDIYSVATAVDEDQPNFPPSAWLAGEGWTSPVLRDTADGAAHKAFGYGGFPYWVFIDGAGNVVRRSAGELGIGQLEEYLAEIAPGGI